LKCPLGLIALRYHNRRVIYSGSETPDVLLIGEAPGESELVTLEPFTGRSGYVLHSMIQDTKLKDFKLGFSNAILCPPQLTPQSKLRTPKKTEIDKCSSNLKSLIYETKPRAIVAVGKVAERSLLNLDYTVYTSSQLKGNPILKTIPFPLAMTVVHPSSILRQEEGGIVDVKKTKDTFNLIAEYLS
jgi:uracil-DNA glycosylase family 4